MKSWSTEAVLVLFLFVLMDAILQKPFFWNPVCRFYIFFCFSGIVIASSLAKHSVSSDGFFKRLLYVLTHSGEESLLPWGFWFLCPGDSETWPNFSWLSPWSPRSDWAAAIWKKIQWGNFLVSTQNASRYRWLFSRKVQKWHLKPTFQDFSNVHGYEFLKLSFMHSLTEPRFYFHRSIFLADRHSPP